MQNLPLEIREFDDIRVNQPNCSDSGTRKGEGCRTSESAYTDDENLAGSHSGTAEMSNVFFHRALPDDEEPLPYGEEALVDE